MSGVSVSTNATVSRLSMSGASTIGLIAFGPRLWSLVNFAFALFGSPLSELGNQAIRPVASKMPIRPGLGQ